MPRIVSLIASATEIVCALGFEDQLVGRSHECDYPPSVKRLPVCTGPRFDVDGSSREIDERVKSTLAAGSSVYSVDADLLRELRPDVIVTQAQCAVCAVSERDVELALDGWIGTRPAIVILSPDVLADIWKNIEQVAQALGTPEKGRAVVDGLRKRIADITARVGTLADKPTVACLEWLDPLMAAGNWMPELVELAGGVNLFGQAGKHSPWMTMDDLERRDPDIIIALPCGFDLERTRKEMATLMVQPRFRELRAVRDGQVFVTDGNQFFNRPGPRLVESLEILAEILHPRTFAFGHRGIDFAHAAG